MSVDSVSAYSTQTAAAAAAAAAGSPDSSSATGGASQQLSQADFLSLIVAQLKNQDPTQPTDPNQFVQEFASLSEVSGITGMGTSMSNLASAMQSSQLAGGTSLIGRQVLASGTSATLASGGTVSGAVQAPSGATRITVQVADASGRVVRTFHVAPQSSGLTDFTWDGLSDTGAAEPAGTYTFTTTTVSGGQQTSLSPYFEGKVTSVTLDPSSNTLTLNTDSGARSLSDVLQVN